MVVICTPVILNRIIVKDGQGWRRNEIYVSQFQGIVFCTFMGSNPENYQRKLEHQVPPIVQNPLFHLHHK